MSRVMVFDPDGKLTIGLVALEVVPRYSQLKLGGEAIPQPEGNVGAKNW